MSFFHLACHILHSGETELLNFLISQETGEKRKSSKRTIKSEKELLEFTLKYQQVLAERDAGVYYALLIFLLYLNFLACDN